MSAAPSISTARIFLICVSGFLKWLISLHNDGAVHPGFAMSRDQAGEFECAGLAEPPENLRGFARIDAFRIWIVMLHPGVFLHQLGVLVVVLNACQRELMLERTFVLDDEADLLAFIDVESVGYEFHRSIAVAHDDSYGARRPFRIAGYARRIVLALMGGRGEQSCSQKQRGAGSDKSRSRHVFAPCQWPPWPLARGFTTVTSISPSIGRAEPWRCGASGAGPLTSRATVPAGCLYQPGSL